MAPHGATISMDGESPASGLASRPGHRDDAEDRVANRRRRGAQRARACAAQRARPWRYGWTQMDKLMKKMVID